MARSRHVSAALAPLECLSRVPAMCLRGSLLEMPTYALSVRGLRMAFMPSHGVPGRREIPRALQKRAKAIESMAGRNWDEAEASTVRDLAHTAYSSAGQAAGLHLQNRTRLLYWLSFLLPYV